MFIDATVPRDALGDTYAKSTLGDRGDPRFPPAVGLGVRRFPRMRASSEPRHKRKRYLLRTRPMGIDPLASCLDQYKFLAFFFIFFHNIHKWSLFIVSKDG